MFLRVFMQSLGNQSVLMDARSDKLCWQVELLIYHSRNR